MSWPCAARCCRQPPSPRLGPRETSAADARAFQVFRMPSRSACSGMSRRRALIRVSPGRPAGSHVLVRLRGASVAGIRRSRSRASRSLAEQAAFISRILAVAPSTEVLATTQLAINSVIAQRRRCRISWQLARDTCDHACGTALSNYGQDLSETVPYIGARHRASTRRARQGRARRGDRQRYRLHACRA